jgi:hypothetical protein
MPDELCALTVRQPGPGDHRRATCAPLAEPVPCKGKLGLVAAPGDVEHQARTTGGGCSVPDTTSAIWSIRSASDVRTKISGSLAVADLKFHAAGLEGETCRIPRTT